MSDNNGYEEYEDYLNHLQEAEKALSRALDNLYKFDGIRRGLGYRLRVGRAHSLIMTLLVRELNQKEGRITNGAHEWEGIDNKWECIYCERRVTPKKIGNWLVFGPDVVRYIPLYGRRWRCDG